jgi:FMN-dependent NADH-azoreductase
MSRLLYIEASPRKQRSASIEVARAFLDTWRAAHPDANVDTMDLWHESLPEFDGAMLAAKYAVLTAQSPTADEAAAWAHVQAIATRLTRADRVVIATPMWNFSIPYKLKHWLDLVIQPGITFGYDPSRGYYGLVNSCKALCIYARGGDYGGDAAAYDQQTKYLGSALGFMGITDQTAITIDRGLHGADADRAARDAAREQAIALAATF